MNKLISLLALAAVAVACNSSDMASNNQTGSNLPDTSQSDPQNTAYVARATEVMVFNGTGVSTSDWQTTEELVKGQGLSYQLVNSAQLNAMTVDQIANFGLIIVPGGHGGTIASSLTAQTQLNLRHAVRDYGTSYLGFCAGAWVAVGPEADGEQAAGYGFALAKGDVLPGFSPGGQNPTAAMVPVTFADKSVRYLVWWGGPSTPEWTNGVVARYDTGVPAISETWSGKGYVVVSGPHPEAPMGWRATAGNDVDGVDYDIAIKLIQAALKKQPLSAF